MRASSLLAVFAGLRGGAAFRGPSRRVAAPQSRAPPARADVALPATLETAVAVNTGLAAFGIATKQQSLTPSGAPAR